VLRRLGAQQEKLTVDGQTTPRGQVLIMGGDEIYPNASQEAYQWQLRDPYDWAFPDPNPGLLRGPPVYAIPGNHDWYDGLVQFLALFSRQEHLHLGGCGPSKGAVCSWRRYHDGMSRCRYP
jgi:DNA repair exonuclease SbcCD nuclease subunit